MITFDFIAMVIVVIIGCAVDMLAHVAAEYYHELKEYWRWKKGLDK